MSIRLVRWAAMNTPLMGSTGIVMPVRSLVVLIAAAGLATDDPDEGSGPLTRAACRLQHMSRSRCRLGTLGPWP
jgi:hypothetical protein